MDNKEYSFLHAQMTYRSEEDTAWEGLKASRVEFVVEAAAGAPSDCCQKSPLIEKEEGARNVGRSLAKGKLEAVLH